MSDAFNGGALSLSPLLQATVAQAVTPQPQTMGPLYNIGAQTPTFVPPSVAAPWARNAPASQFASGGHVGRQQSGYVVGPGDGKSDSVPARTPDGALSALSDGEFVFSAPAVANLGRGSNAAGARKLDAVHHALLHGDFHGALSALK